MIRYHGGPVTPLSACVSLWTARHAFVSFARPDQIAVAADVCQSFALDNGAFSFWKAGQGEIDIGAYAEFVQEWQLHPAFDWCVIPDSVDGDHNDNARLRAAWYARGMRGGVPVYHLHEPLEVLRDLAHSYDRVALGSSGEYAQPETPRWWARMAEMMSVVCDEEGRPRTRLHGLRMLAPTIFSHVPLASADSTNAAQNVGLDTRWVGPYQPMTKDARAIVMRDRVEAHAAAARWCGSAGVQRNMEIIG